MDEQLSKIDKSEVTSGILILVIKKPFNLSGFFILRENQNKYQDKAHFLR